MFAQPDTYKWDLENNMDVVNEKMNELSAERIKLQKSFTDYNIKNGFSYEEWVNPNSDHFYADYKEKLAIIDNQMSPALQYQS